MRLSPIKRYCSVCILAITFLFVSFNPVTAGEVYLLNASTGLEDREINGVKLSERINQGTTDCLVQNNIDPGTEITDKNFFKCINKLLNALKKEGFLTGDEKDIAKTTLSTAKQTYTGHFVFNLSAYPIPWYGTLVSDATVTLEQDGSLLGSTDATGTVTVNLDPTVQDQTLNVTHPNYFPNKVYLNLVPGVYSADGHVHLIERETYAIQIDDQTGQLFVDISDGLRIEFDPNAFGADIPTEFSTIFGTASAIENSGNLNIGAVQILAPGHQDPDAIQYFYPAIFNFGFFDAAGNEITPVEPIDYYAWLTETHYFDETTIEAGDMLSIQSPDESGQWTEVTEGTVVEDNNSPTGLAVEFSTTATGELAVGLEKPSAYINVTIEDSSTSQRLAALLYATSALNDTPFTESFNHFANDAALQFSVMPDELVCFHAIVSGYPDGTTAGTALGTVTQPHCTTVAEGGTGNIVLSVGGFSDVDLGIVSTLDSFMTDEYLLTGTVGTAVQDNAIYSSFRNDDVTYSVDTNTPLPAGLSLVQSADTYASIVGVPEVDGSYEITIGATDPASSAQDSITVTIEIGGDTVVETQAPIFAYAGNIGATEIQLPTGLGSGTANSYNTNYWLHSDSLPIEHWVIDVQIDISPLEPAITLERGLVDPNNSEEMAWFFTIPRCATGTLETTASTDATTQTAENSTTLTIHFDPTPQGMTVCP